MLIDRFLLRNLSLSIVFALSAGASQGNASEPRPLPPQKILEDLPSQEMNKFPDVKILSCKDLGAFDDNLIKQCNAVYKTLMNGDATNIDSKKICEDEIGERSTCEGLLEGVKLSSCDDLIPLAAETCTRFKKAAVKTCDSDDQACKKMEQMLHGYLHCADSSNSELIAACVGFQNAYMDGISAEWLRQSFLPLANANKAAKSLLINNAPSLAFVNKKRIEALNISKEDLELLINFYPTLTRSVLLNTPHTKSQFTSNSKFWSEIESHLDATQTVGFELECPGVKLDITSGNDNKGVRRMLRYDGDLEDFVDLLTKKEIAAKKLALDAAFEKEFSDDLEVFTRAGVWKANAEWPYFDTYGLKLFQSDLSRMSLPLVAGTLESRYSLNAFPHIEMVTAPLTRESTPLNFKNTMSYLSDIVTETCDLKDDRKIKFTGITEWKNLAASIPTHSGHALDYEYTGGSTFSKSSLTCQSDKLDHCHVQSNVGVYLDQLFTDNLLVQSIGSNAPYNTDKVYQAAWALAKQKFTLLQWDTTDDRMVDARNHAAGMFTYFIYDLYLRSILYAGGFDFWKGTLSHLMKYDLRHVWSTLNDAYSSENEQALFQKAILSVWADPKLPKELASLTEKVLEDLIRTGRDGGDPSLPSGELPVYSEEFAEKVNGIFKELIWTIGIADEETYTNTINNYWGSVVSDGTDLTYIDPNDGSTRTRKGFVQGCSYGSHDGSQCDLAKVIEPVRSSVEYNGEAFERIYAVIETRYGNADFNKAVFWRCHEDDRSSKLNSCD